MAILSDSYPDSPPPGCDATGALSTEQRKEARRLMIAAILATDMAHHQVYSRAIAVIFTSLTTTLGS